MNSIFRSTILGAAILFVLDEARAGDTLPVWSGDAGGGGGGHRLIKA